MRNSLSKENENCNNTYFLDHTILTPRNVQVHGINTTILEGIQPQEKTTYVSADSITNREYDYVQPEVLHSLNPARFPLHKLELKNGAPLMLLRNLDPIHELQWNKNEADQVYS